MVVIRLARTGRAKYPTYRIVAADSKRPATGKFVEILGHYNPHTKELVIKKEEAMKRLETGAQPSNTVVKLMLREKMELPTWVKLKTKQAKVTDEPVIDEPAAATPKTEASPDDDPAVATTATDQAAEADTTDATEEHTETATDTDAAADAAKADSAAADETPAK